MQIIDSFPTMATCFPAGAFSLDAWRTYAAAISPELPDKCLADAGGYDFPTQVLPVLEAFATAPDKAAQAHHSFLRHIESLREIDVHATIVLYLGLCSGAGWATTLEGRPAVLLGLEKIVELDWCDDTAMAALINHELGHLWHAQHRSAPAFENQALWQLYTEGIAMYFEQRLAGDRQLFHQNKNGWLPWCEANRDALLAEYLRRVQAGEPVQDFFGDWCSYQGYSDVGYYLGSLLVWRLAERRTPAPLADLSQTEFLSAFSK